MTIEICITDFQETTLDLLQSLHVMHPRDLPHSVHDFLEVFQVGDFEDYVHAGLAVLAARFYVADVGVGVADEGGDLFEHAEAVVAEKRDFYGIGNRLAVFVAGPEHVDAAVGFVEKISDVGTVDGVDGNAFTASDVSDDGLAANGVATLGTINEKVAGPGRISRALGEPSICRSLCRPSGRRGGLVRIRWPLFAGRFP